MRRGRRIGAAFIAASCLFAALPAWPQEPAAEKPTVTSDFDAIGSRVRESSEIQSRYAVCPASIARKARPLWRPFWPSAEWSVKQCGEDVDACQSDCLTALNENACFALARTFEEAKPVVSPHIAQMLFAQACALGSRGGCTNRAAGIRNGQYDGDPMLSQPPGTLDGCYYDTFTISCADGDAWGCAMLGQSYQFGEGVEKNEPEARRHYLRACEINPDFSSCDFAKSHLQGLESR